VISREAWTARARHYGFATPSLDGPEPERGATGPTSTAYRLPIDNHESTIDNDSTIKDQKSPMNVSQNNMRVFT